MQNSFRENYFENNYYFTIDSNYLLVGSVLNLVKSVFHENVSVVTIIENDQAIVRNDICQYKKSYAGIIELKIENFQENSHVVGIIENENNFVHSGK